MLVRAAWTLLIFHLSVALVVSWSLWPDWATALIGAVLLGAIALRWRAGLVRRDPSRCRHCDYDMTGLEQAGECPECGEPFQPRWDLEAVLRARGVSGEG